MGTYTTNYQLYMPTVGETGWGTLVNANFSTIDSTMKSLSNRITAIENEVNGALSCTSVTTSGKITGNGGIAGTTGTFSGAVTASNIKTSITVTSSTNWFKLPASPTNASSQFNCVILPLLLGVVYSGSIIFTTPVNSYPAEIVAITSSNTITSLGTCGLSSSTTTASFSNVKAVYYTAMQTYGNQNMFRIPVLS